MRWDIFCKVIDNFGDIGVCWRLSRGLAARGQSVRLWVDDASALAWMAPHVHADGHGEPGVEVRSWPAPSAPCPPSTTHPSAHLDWPEPAEVVVEAFGCELPEGFVARMRRAHPPVWINLEYLSAEDYVERSHGLPSPVMSGPGAGLVKRFFYPGFTAATGGLLRPGAAPPSVPSDEERAKILHAVGVDWAPGERVVVVFCYPGAPVAALLDALAAGPRPCRVLLTPGAATLEGSRWLAGRGPAAGAPLLARVQVLPALPQPVFDQLLRASDLNFVRGEDSAVQALWAARPHVWQIYPQDDGVHAGKLDAFMARWMAPWPEALRREVRALWQAWNGLGVHGDEQAPPRALPAFRALWHGPLWPAWEAAARDSAEKLAQQQDLVTQVLRFVTAAR